MGAQAPGHVQVHLQGAALPVAADGIPQHELELGAVEGALARVQACTRCPAASAAALQGGLGLVPDRIRRPPASAGRSANLMRTSSKPKSL